VEVICNTVSLHGGIHFPTIELDTVVVVCLSTLDSRSICLSRKLALVRFVPSSSW